MRKLMPFLASLSTLTFANVALAAPYLVPAPVQDVFVPVGFDANDEIVTVLDGYLPNSCYSLAHSETHFDEATRRYTVKQWAWLHPDVICLQVIAPFTTEVQLGVRAEGDYTVAAAGNVEPLRVKPAVGPGPDDFLYAPVESAIVERDGAGSYRAIVRGRLTNTCLTWEDVRVVDSGRTLEVLPIVTYRGADDCATANVPYTKEVQLPRGMSAGRHLLHVRSLSGKSVNTVFSVY